MFVWLIDLLAIPFSSCLGTEQTWGMALHGSAVSSMRAGGLGLGLCTVAVTCDSEQCRVAGGLEHDPGTWKI